MPRRLNDKGSALVLTIVICMLLSIMVVTLLYTTKKYNHAVSRSQKDYSFMQSTEYLTIRNISENTILPDFVYLFFRNYSALIKDYDQSTAWVKIYEDFYDTDVVQSCMPADTSAKRVYSAPHNYTVAEQDRIFVNGLTDIPRVAFTCSNVVAATRNNYNEMIIGCIVFERYEPHGGTEEFLCHLVFTKTAGGITTDVYVETR